MPDFLLELLSEEIPARMQDKAREDLARLFAAEIGKAGLETRALETCATPRRLVLIARGLPAETEAVREETKGPRASAPPQALEGFLRKTGLARDQLEERDGVLFAVVENPGRPTAAVLAEAIPAMIHAFPWPKSMRWGEASVSTESLRWVRPLQGIVALLGEEIVDFEIAGIRSGAATVGHRFHHSGTITIGSANDYVEKLKACHVVVDQEERKRIVRDGARAAAEAAGLALVEDEGLVTENAGLTEWPVPLLGAFDPAYLDVPPEVIQLTMRTNQKYFAMSSSPERGGGPAKPVEGAHLSAASESGPLHHPSDGPPPRSGEERGSLAPAFICVANIEAADGGAAIVKGNERVLSARLADAKFFWEQDLKVPLEDQAKKLSDIVFHEKLGTIADKVERVAKLARWLVEEGIISSSPERGGGPPPKAVVEGSHRSAASDSGPLHQPASGPPPRSGEELADLAERAARLAKADLVTGLVGEFPELQGIIGGHLARAQGEPPEVADAIRDHYKPAGQGDEVPTAPVTVAVSLADKLDTLFAFLAIGEGPTGSRDPYALRRQILGAIGLILKNRLRLPLSSAFAALAAIHQEDYAERMADDVPGLGEKLEHYRQIELTRGRESFEYLSRLVPQAIDEFLESVPEVPDEPGDAYERLNQQRRVGAMHRSWILGHLWFLKWTDVQSAMHSCLIFAEDRLKVQQREAGVRHDLIDAVFALGVEDDLVRLLARVRALQAFVETPQGADLLAGYKRAANILKKEGWEISSPSRGASGEDSRGLSSPDAGGARPAEPGGRVRDINVAQPWPTDAPAETEHPKNKKLSYTPEKDEARLIEALDSAEPRARAAVEAEGFEGAMAALASLRAPVDAFFDKV
ncbi:MAG: glycyl-tRNA synthetase beta chain, partial [Sphingomonadales bacterium]|nr:glycyl-tRNA synthetase beta chain [Sphingomonadales bacterium]